MTELNKPVTRRTRLPHRRGRRLVVTMLPGDVIELREERTRTAFYLTIGAAFDVAVKMYVAAKRAEKRKGRAK